MDPADADGPRRKTQAWMGPSLGPPETSPSVPAGSSAASNPAKLASPAPAKALRWMPDPGELPSYPNPGPDAGAAAPVGLSWSAPATTPAAPVAAPPGSASAHRVDEVVGERYRLRRMLGQGALTETWEAHHIDLQRAVAIKFLRQQALGVGEQMLEVARAVSRVRHPHVVEFSDFGRDSGGDPYFVMELLAGQTVEQLIARRGTVAWSRAVNIAQQVATALTAAHQGDIIHRDLRPGNVFLIDTGEPGDFIKVVDFGLARGTTIGGTLAYMSPEQCRNEQLDPRSDVYALGCLIYAMVTGEPPFVGDPERLRFRQMSETPRLLRDKAPRQFIPEELEAIVSRCLEKIPARRFADARELGAALASLASFAAAASIAAGVIPNDASASGSRPMGFAGRPPPKSPAELTNSYKAVQQPVAPSSSAKDERSGLGLPAILGIGLGTLLIAGAAGVGVWWFVSALIHDSPGSADSSGSSVSAPADAGAAAGTAPPGAGAPSPTPEASGQPGEPVQPPQPEDAGPNEIAAGEGEAAAEVEAPATTAPAAKRGSGGAAPPEPAPASDADAGDPEAAEPAEAPEPKPEPKPSAKPKSKANEGIGHEELIDPWD